jgi:hypothetical protein
MVECGIRLVMFFSLFVNQTEEIKDA